MSSPTIIRSKRKTISLQIARDGTLTVRAPLKAPKRMIDAILKEKRDWIARHQIKQLAKHKEIPRRSFTEEETLPFLGKEYPIVIDDTQQRNIRFTDDGFFLKQHPIDQTRLTIETWYRAMARDIITDRVEEYAIENTLKYSGIRLSSAEKRWGSCSASNSLNFNWRLILAPLDVIDYVVVHELAHTREKNHSIAFWKIVESMLPEFKKPKKWLKQKGHLLHI